MTIREEIERAKNEGGEYLLQLKQEFRKAPTWSKSIQFEPDPDNPKQYYKELEKRIKKGDIPATWQKIWAEMRQMVRYLYLQDPYSIPSNVSFRMDVISSYYYEHFIIDAKMKKFSTGRLLNGYLTRQLKSEGFKTACLRLVHIRGNPWAKQMNATLQSNYERNLGDWQAKKAEYDSFRPNGIMDGPSNPGRAPSAPTFYSTQESQYYLQLVCAIDKDRRLKNLIKDAETKEKEATERSVIR